jgi:hypothetical protein
VQVPAQAAIHFSATSGGGAMDPAFAGITFGRDSF